MAERIAAHRARRAAGWQTVEAPHDLAGALEAAPAGRGGAGRLPDALAFESDGGSSTSTRRRRDCRRRWLRRAGPTVIVSNEVGLGIVPDNALARRFRDLQGTLNQKVAAQAARVIMMVAGLPVTVKSP